MQTGIPNVRRSDPSIDEVLNRHGNAPDQLLPILRSLQSQEISLDKDALTQVAQGLNVPAARVCGVATFYSMLDDHGYSEDQTVRLCDGVVCWLKGFDNLKRVANDCNEKDTPWHLTRSSCLGLCDRAPAALVGGHAVGPVDSLESLRPHASKTSVPLKSPVLEEPNPCEHRVLLNRVGRIDPMSIQDALSAGIYDGLRKAIRVGQSFVLDEIDQSQLTGRGGAGFPTARKWRLVATSAQKKRYVVCNADESEPLMFKDRVLLESDPHSVLEGILIAGLAVQAQKGFIYIRGEYEAQARILEHAIHQAKEQSLLGRNILGSSFSFEIEIHRGAGAYICGEETALIESLEGRRGEPRVRPPYPAQSGYHGCPTLVNNVETLATVGAVMRLGAERYLKIGNPEQPGTRLHTLLGHVNQTGLFELPHGMTLREIIDRVGMGMRESRQLGFVLVGGAAGTLVGAQHLDIPLNRAASEKCLATGSGGILVCDDRVSPIAVLRELMRFFEVESCGKCTPCRVGTRVATGILDRILAGAGTLDDVVRLRSLADTLKTSFCGLGTSVVAPLISCLHHFPKHFEDLVKP